MKKIGTHECRRMDLEELGERYRHLKGNNYHQCKNCGLIIYEVLYEGEYHISAANYVCDTLPILASDISCDDFIIREILI